MTAGTRQGWERARTATAIIAMFIGAVALAVAARSWVIAAGATQENTRDLATTAQTTLETCQTGNRTRPQIEINILVQNDAILRAFGVSIAQRRALAAAAVDSLSNETLENGSIGPRDCNDDGRISGGDYLLGIPPPPLLGPDGLPHITQEVP